MRNESIWRLNPALFEQDLKPRSLEASDLLDWADTLNDQAVPLIPTTHHQDPES